MRECIRRSQELDECRERVARLEQEVDRLQTEKRLILEEREEHASSSRPSSKSRDSPRSAPRLASVTRAKWWLFGRDRGDE